MKFTQGGARKGSGRPKSGNVKITLNIPESLAKRIRRDAKECCMSTGRIVAEKFSR